MPCSSACACLVEPGLECLSVSDPARFGYFASWCRSGDTTKRAHVLARSRIAVGQPLPAPTAIALPSSPSIPLAGDLVAELTRRLGADRAAKWVADKLGTDCGCAARREKLNALDQTVRRWLGRSITSCAAR